MTGAELLAEALTPAQVAAVRDVLGNRLASTTQGLLALAEIHEHDYADPAGAAMLRDFAASFADHDAKDGG
jgi:hypothetical protein